MTDNVLDDLVQLGVEPHRIIAVNSGDQIRALPEVDRVLLAPLDPFVVTVAKPHF
jgi:hypothetical protein